MVIPIPADPRGRRPRKGSRDGRPPSFDRDAYEQRNTVERCTDNLFLEGPAHRLQEDLAECGGTDLGWAPTVGGHPVDLLFTSSGENAAVLINPGPPPGGDPARKLRLVHVRGDLLNGLPSGGYGSKA
ncbi:hypothetical protein ACFV0T_10825 [Streptomyces sp. NPDC059582]|uniref:hypothetical protein n=1 Tax=Streptomyces sp. NPDC059582 TaxID=3346875 RepID=UPI0036CC77C7